MPHAFALLEILEQAVNAGTIPGAVVVGARGGLPAIHQSVGARQIAPVRLPAHLRTVYDVASLTKAVCTSVLAMKAVATGRLELGDRVSKLVADFDGPGKEMIRVRHLLSHSAGLPAHRPFHGQVKLNGKEGDAIVRAAAREPLVAAPGTSSIYSDLGFILLGRIIETALEARLDVLFRDLIAAPLGLQTATFIRVGDSALCGEGPSAADSFVSSHDIAPTELCLVRGGGAVLGAVHDLNAYAMGGVAGHAGLFSDAGDLGRIAQALVSAWQGENAGSPIVPREVIREFWRPSGIPGSTWRLGWDGPSLRDSQAGEKLSRDAVGHLGFTGCSIWIDPAQALWIVLLTNRVHPTVRADPRFRALRASVNDAVIDLLAAGSPVDSA